MTKKQSNTKHEQVIFKRKFSFSPFVAMYTGDLAEVSKGDAMKRGIRTLLKEREKRFDLDNLLSFPVSSSSHACLHGSCTVHGSSCGIVCRPPAVLIKVCRWNDSMQHN